jgi:hypothetical protein
MTRRRRALSALAVITVVGAVTASGSAMLAGTGRGSRVTETASNHEKAVEVAFAGCSRRPHLLAP